MHNDTYCEAIEVAADVVVGAFFESMDAAELTYTPEVYYLVNSELSAFVKQLFRTKIKITSADTLRPRR